MIDGKKRDGKTNLALKLLEDAYEEGLIHKIATNIGTKDSRVEKLCYYNDLDEWLQTRGRKGFLLDELGKHLNRVRFMTELSKLIFDVIQLAGHYDCHFIGCCPTEGLVDKLFMDTDILDLKIHKTSKKRARFKNYLTRQNYTLRNIPSTRISYNSKDVAKFELVNPRIDPIKDFDKKPKCCQCADYYLALRSFRKIALIMRCSIQNVGDLLDRHCKHANLTRLKVSTTRVEVVQVNSRK